MTIRNVLSYYPHFKDPENFFWTSNGLYMSWSVTIYFTPSMSCTFGFFLYRKRNTNTKLKLLTFSNLIKLEDGNLQKSINVYLSIVSGKMNIQRNKIKISMFVCTMVLNKYMKLLRNDISNLSHNMYVLSKIYWKFNDGIVYSNERCLIRMVN